ncbi:hypothetical protein LXH09_19755 [Streptomyces sp. CS7]|uniref:hypothetical protein n=1 Tax=Streptomyces TaxID=1883 RepID=UPI0021B2FEBD|nr:hypothetical protein [Streptomyces sp. CS-7]MCT6778872.1 hypothetical protein [Streptomyces sp. CS-7]
MEANAQQLAFGQQVLEAQPFSVLLRARAQVVRPGRSRVVCRCDLLMVDAEGEETLCAVAQGTIAVAAERPPDRYPFTL